jgi:serine protease Do
VSGVRPLSFLLRHKDYGMRTKLVISTISLAGLLVSASSAQTAAPRARTASRHVVVQRGGSYLGIGVVEIDSDRAKALHLKEERGIEVRCVDEDSPAAKAGLKEGDVVLEYNGQRVEGGEQFMRLVRETPPGRTATLLIWRNGATQTVAATVGQRRPGAMAFEMDGDEFSFTLPPTPPMPSMPAMPSMPSMPSIHIPDIPRSFMSWRSPLLGIESESLNPQLAEFFGVKEGVLVRSVNRDSSAEKAGFKAGDVIVKVDGEKVTTPREISSILQSSRSKRNLPVTIVRRQKEMVLNVALEENSQWLGLEMRELL